MANIGIIGLGTMGLPIAENLLNKKHNIFISKHKNADSIIYLQNKGATTLETFSDVIRKSEILFLVLPNTIDVELILKPLLNLELKLENELTIIDFSTIDLESSKKFYQNLQKKGITYIDAPISGGPKGAKSATLSIMVGATEEQFLKIQPFLKILGTNITYCGSQGMGLVAKMANNLIVASQLVAISEAVALAYKAGIKPEKLFEVLNNATASSKTLTNKTSLFLDNCFDPPGFKLSLMHKDLEIITKSANTLDSPMLIGTLVREMFKLAKKNFGELDSSAINLLYQQLAGNLNDINEFKLT